MFKLDEIQDFLLTHFPMCDWRIVPMTWQKGQMILWKPSKKFEIEIHIGHFQPTINDGAEYISLDWNNKNGQEGGGCACKSKNDLERNIKQILKRYDPKLLDVQLLTLF